MGFFKSFFKALTNPATLISAAAMAFFAPVAFVGGTFLASVAVYAAANAALSALSPKPKMPDLSGYGAFVGEATNRTQMIKQPAQPRRVIYGQIRVSGVLSYISTTNSDKTLHMIISMATHEIESFEKFQIDGIEVTTIGGAVQQSRFRKGGSRFGSFLAELKEHNGANNQIADTFLVQRVPEWTTDHRLRGIAYVYAQLEFDQDAFPQGLPNISATVKGAKVFDPRNSSTAFSDNSALCIRDFLTNTRYGLGCSADEIDDTSFIAAANTCDENITLAAGGPTTGTEKRYTCNGSFETNQSPKQILENLLTSCAGILTYTNGKFRLLVGEFRSASLSLDENDFHGPVTIDAKQSMGESYNTVKGVYSPEDNGYVATDYPPITSSTFVTEDNGETRTFDYDLPFTTSSATAQRLAKIALFRNRQQIVLQGQLSMKGFNLAIGDSVQVTFDRFGFTNKIFEVAEWNIAVVGGRELGVDITLRETASAVYDWNAEESYFNEDNSTLPNPFTIPAPNLVTSDFVQTLQQGAITNLRATVTSTSTYASQFEVQAKLTTDTQYTSMGTQAANIFDLVNVPSGVTFDVRARAISSFGIRSAFTTVQHTITGKGTSQPSNVSDFTLDYLGSNALLTWTPVTDQDLSHYVIRHQNVTSGGDFSSGITLAQKVSRPANSVIVPALEGTYFCVAVDKYGNNSATAAQTIGIIDQSPVSTGFKVVQTNTQSPNFDGVKTNVIKPSDEDVLVLETTILFDSGTGLFDDADGLFDGGVDGVVATSGNYDFDSVIDLTLKQTSRITFNITQTRRQYDVIKPTSQGTTDCELLIATTDDDPTSPSASFTAFSRVVAGDYTCRGMKFRLRLTTIDIDDTPVVSALSVTVAVGPRQESQGNVSSGTSASGKTITFTNGFASIDGITIAGQNMNSGEFYQITNKTTSGFTIIFKESNGNVVDRTFDFVANGHGTISI
tara:strand:- start:6895 stop:9768 length:2874 start_codon:yes stop_codon:yes gene_type:complete